MNANIHQHKGSTEFRRFKRFVRLFGGSLLVGLLWTPVLAAGEPELRNAAYIESLVAHAKAGDRVELPAGLYQLTKNLVIKARGTAQAPIHLAAAAGARVVLERASARYNVFEVRDSEHLVIEGIEVRGGSHGIRLVNSNAVTIQDCEVHHTADVAISANAYGTYRNLVIRRNHIHHTGGTGEGLYLGCNRNKCRVLDSVIEDNYIHHTNGPTVEQGDGIELKEGSAGNLVRGNVIHDTRYPGILTYSTVGNGPPNRIVGNLIFNSEEYGMQVAADADIDNNIVFGTVAFQPHQNGRPSNIRFRHNTVIDLGDALRIRRPTGPVLIHGNAIYSRYGKAIVVAGFERDWVTLAHNYGRGGLSGRNRGYRESAGVAKDFGLSVRPAWPGVHGVTPLPDSVLVGKPDTPTALQLDYRGCVRERFVAGALVPTSGGRAWPLGALLEAVPPVLKPLLAAPDSSPCSD